MKGKFLTVFSILLILSTVSLAQITSATSGNWSIGSTWNGGAVPTASSDVVIGAGNTITIDPADAVCKSLTIKSGATLKFRNDGTAASLTINGDLIVQGNASAGAEPGVFICDSTASSTYTSHSLTLFGNLTVEAGADNPGTLVFRMGTNGATSAGCDITLAGSANTEIKLQRTILNQEKEYFNGITVDKSGGAKVILSSGNLFQSNNSTTGPASLIFKSGMVETGENNIWVILTSSSSGLNTAKPDMYVNGNLGRGLSSGADNNRTFDVGDANGYRPLKVYDHLPTGSGEYLVVKCVSGNANNGSSTFVGEIDKVSAVRYWKLNYYSGVSGTTSIEVNRMYAYYGTDDGVSAGNTDLQLAVSSDERATWTGGITASHTTALPAAGAAPTEIRTSNPFSPTVVLNDSTKAMYVALARAAGTTTNSLGAETSIEKEDGIPTEYLLSQNYPNPFNPETIISFSIPNSSRVSLKIYDVIGKEVASLVDDMKEAGNYKLSFNASDLSSGIYFYRLQAGSFSSVRKMILVK